MKKILIAVIAAQAAPSLLAHEMQGGSTSGLFGLKPEYIHVLLNPLPAYGLMVGIAVLLSGFVFKHPVLRATGLIIVAVCTAAAWPVLYFGQHGYNSLYTQIDTESQQWLDIHMSRAERFIYVFYATAALAIVGLLCLKKSSRTAAALGAATLLASFGCLGVGAWIARAGGEVSHSEFRAEGSSPEMPAHEHQHGLTEHAESSKAETSPASQGHEHTPPATQGDSAHTGHPAPTTAPTNQPQPEHQHSPDSTQTISNATPHHAHADHATASQSSTNNSQSAHDHQAVAPGTNAQPASSPQHDHANAAAPAHSQGTNNTPSANWTPDTPEGIWKELHRHLAELQTAIATKKLDQIHAHAEAVKRLTAALVQVVHPDYKASVGKGAEKINQAISAAHESAHADDLAGVEANFKQFSDALHELEQQMKKQ
jgi:hypothetical protein